jgi:hypothetical protein
VHSGAHKLHAFPQGSACIRIHSSNQEPPSVTLNLNWHVCVFDKNPTKISSIVRES